MATCTHFDTSCLIQPISAFCFPLSAVQPSWHKHEPTAEWKHWITKTRRVTFVSMHTRLTTCFGAHFGHSKCIWRSSLNTTPDGNLALLFSQYTVFIILCTIAGWFTGTGCLRTCWVTQGLLPCTMFTWYTVLARCRTEGLSAKRPWLCECMNVLQKQFGDKSQRITEPVYHPRCERTRRCRFHLRPCVAFLFN